MYARAAPTRHPPHCALAAAPLLGQLLVLLALAASTGQGESRHQPPEPPVQARVSEAPERQAAGGGTACSS